MDLSRITRYNIGNDETLKNLRTKPEIWEHLFMPTIFLSVFSLKVWEIIQKIGEEIEFEIVPGNHFERGIVQSVTHCIKGKSQHIEIIAHPLETDYDRWMELKGKYEKRQRWLKQIKNSNKFPFSINQNHKIS